MTCHTSSPASPRRSTSYPRMSGAGSGTSTRTKITSMPSLAIYRELLHEKLSDPKTVWEDNDLNDMMYLSCGAAYADHVVAERRLTSDLRHGLERLGWPVNVYRRLADLIPVLAS